jgi:hypothetical protein
MRKKLTAQQTDAVPHQTWLDVERLASAELSSEDPEHPIEAALRPGGAGWRASAGGRQTIRLAFDEPQHLHRIRLRFEERERGRTQEFVLGWSTDGGGSFREIVRQQFTFSPTGTSVETETYEVDLRGVGPLQLSIVPDIGGSDAVASLKELRIA